jgi:transcriptional regulator with PAS, ATPase and Fis domain
MPFLVINCVAIPETLLESEVFGYEKGAFTGASHRRIGKIEQAHRGTVFLDEIGDMPLSIQAKILRLLQEKSIERLGGRGTIPVDVRIIAATNKDLEAAVAEGSFREDLYYRLKVVTITLPPLRDRSDDISLLADYFLALFTRDRGSRNPGVTNDAKTVLSNYAWPGNIRELANTLQKALIFNRGAPITSEDIAFAFSDHETGKEKLEEKGDEAIQKWVRQTLIDHAEEHPFEACMDRFAGIVIAEALRLTGWNRSSAAKLLGLSRPTLHAKIDKYNLKLDTTGTEK